MRAFGPSAWRTPLQRFSVSIGVAIAPEHGGSFEELYAKADVALYHAKQGGRIASSYTAGIRPGFRKEGGHGLLTGVP
ncbi:MAG: diguanylate cyclase domain-containing protein [Bilophila wadsworthia]